MVLSVFGSFDGSSAWALRHEMDAGGDRDFVIDLSHADEACEFAAGVIASYARQRWRDRRIRFRPGDPAWARLLVGYGLEVEGEPAAGTELAEAAAS